MAVPSGHVGRVEARHGFGFDDEILQAFIHRRTQVNRAAGIRRAVVQDVLGRPFSSLPNALVDLVLLPAGQQFGFILGQVGLHGEGSFWQIDGGFQFELHSDGFSPK